MRPLIVLCIVSILILTLYIREGDTGAVHSVRSGVETVATPLRYAGSFVARPFNAIGNIASNLTASKESLSDLKKENQRLTAKVAELSESKKTAARLEKMLKLKSTYNLKSTAAKIIGTSGDGYTSTVTIDKGSADGMKLNMPVTSSVGVIGQIIEVSRSTSKVRLLTDENSGISAMVQDTRAQGMLHGQADGTLKLDYVTSDSDVKVGDIIITSGIGGVYPKGLPLGTITAVDKSTNSVYYTITVKAQATMENNEEVLVITSLTDDQSASSDDVKAANEQDEAKVESDSSTDSTDSSSTDSASE